MNDREALSRDELRRYSRPLLLPEWAGAQAQERLQAASVLVVGAGGLGCPALSYLAGAGVGRIGISDGDTVSLSNLHRQTLYSTPDLGRPKASVAAARLQRLNPYVRPEVLPALQAETSPELVRRYDLVLDCTDNFTTRHAINAACVAAAVPLVSGAAIRFDGQISVFDSRSNASPCYACLFPPTGQAEDINCATMGVFAPVVGIIGAMQAAEALKLITGTGSSLAGRLLLFDGRESEWTSIGVARDPGCTVCGTAARGRWHRPKGC